MPSKNWQAYIHQYFKRFAKAEPLLKAPVDPKCQMTVIIPCHNEPNLLGTLESLANCAPTSSAVEVMVVVNQAVDASESIEQQNQQTIKDFREWNSKQPDDLLHFHLIEALDMPKKQAGVGLARKTGMDEALRRYAGADVDGTIICLDADCQVSPNYLKAIETKFGNSNAGLGELYYEHLFESEANENLKEGIINYELFLRYYVHGLRQAGFPNAIQTVGSCMLVKASVYAKHGGMNKRKAGEDFYFLHKIIPHESFKAVNGAAVYPSCRTSDRVPFGTGKAQQDYVDGLHPAYKTYDPIIFQELKALLDQVPAFFTSAPETALKQLSKANRNFIEKHHYLEKIELIKANTKDLAQFTKQFFVWFDGFICMKHVHFLRDNFYPNLLIGQVAGQLINEKSEDPQALLKMYRVIDRQASI